MDGIEATAHLREMGYKHPIVALTANAVAGQADIFLQNGFDDYLSKPVDIRQMNMVLNKLIRDRHPPETVEAAKKSAAAEKEDKAVSARESKFAGPFLRDAKKAAGVLEPFVKNGGSYSESEMKTYSICIHGMKSALAYIGNQGLSDTAFRLEQLAMKGDAAAIASETPAFIAALKEYVRELESEAGNNLHGQAGARLLGKNIAGLDIAKGIERNNGDGNVYLMLLRTYAANVRLMLKSVESVSEDSLPDYKIIVHGIKGVSYAICAERVGKMAEGLESASGSGDFAYVSAHNEPFIEEAMRLVRDLEELICGIDAENPKPKKDKPDTELLLALLESCRNFDLDGADAAMAEIEKYQYDSDGGLVKWLRENVDLTNLDEIEQKLQDTEG
jgi:CheY-like chemotaxis protein